MPRTIPLSPVRGYDRETGAAVEILAWGDGIHDDGPLLQAMLDQCGLIYLGAGIFDTSITLRPPKVEGCGIIGTTGGVIGTGNPTCGSVIRGTKPDMTVIQSPAFATGPTYKNLVIDRKVDATAGYGLDMNVSCDWADLSNLFITHQMVGIYLGTTGFSKAEYIHVEFCKNNGFAVVGQWQLGRCLATLNGGIGYAVTNYSMPEGNSLGQWTGLSTYANKGHGIAFFGKVFDIRLSDSFFGGDGGFEVYIAQEGNNSNLFTNVMTESGGTTFQWYFGPGSGHNSLVNCSVLGGPSHGLLSYAPRMSIIGGGFTDFPNGYGILAQAGRLSVQGIHAARCGWGIGAGAGVQDISVLGCDLSDCTVPTDLGMAAHSTAYGNM